MSVTLTNDGLARADALQWSHRGKTRVTVVAQAGYRMSPQGLVPDSTAYRTTESSTPALMHPEIIVDGPGGWMRVWRNNEVLLDKSVAAGTAAIPSIAPQRVARLAGHAAPAKTVPHLPDGFDFSYYQVAPEDQWLSHLLPGDVITIYDAQQQPAFTMTIPADEPVVTGSLEFQLRRDRVYIDMTRMQCTICFRGFNFLRDGNHALTVSLSSAAKPSAPHATIGVASWSSNENSPSAVQATMGIGNAPSPSAPLPFAPSSQSPAPPKKRVNFQQLLRQQANAPVPEQVALDGTMAIRAPKPPVPNAPAPPPAVPTPPAEAAFTPAVAPPVMIGEVEHSDGQPIEIGAAPEVAEALDLEMTAFPARKTPDAEPPAAPPPPAAPASSPGPSAGKPKKKDVRKALLRKMRRK